MRPDSGLEYPGKGNWSLWWPQGSLFFVVVYFLLSFPANGSGVKGIYGVPSIRSVDPLLYVGELERAGVNAVFVPADRDTVRWFKNRGFRVYVSVNAFGGQGAWKTYPDSRPVKADGSFLGSRPGYKGHGGICPTHPEWRKERLQHIEKIVKDLGGEEGIDGIWLDFIRYPGRWETPKPKIPDTCYCPGCLKRFQEETEIQMPPGLKGWEAAIWIKKHCPYEWMQWKKAQIASFVSETRAVMEKYQGKSPLTLGLFLVPWTKGERGNEVSYLLAQDPFQLSQLADVISPMVYHKMCGRCPAWVGYMTGYYEETVPCEVWPIVQAVDCPADGLAEAVRSAGQGGADGVLVFSFKGMGMAHWERLGSADFADYTDEKIRRLDGEVSVTAVDEWGAEWAVPLAACEAGVEYVFEGELWRDGWQNGVYPEVCIWDKKVLVNTHVKAKTWQPVRVNVVCPDRISDPSFRLINRNRNKTFRLRRPTLKRRYRFSPEPAIPVAQGFFQGPFFPIGVYGAGLEDLEQIKRLAVNTVMLGGTGENLKKKVEKCHEVGLRYVLSVPPDPDRLPVYLDEIAGYVRPYDAAFYVNDEPGIWSFPVNRANDTNRLIKDRFPGCATCMAIVRPQVCGDYANAGNFFMLDQYPVPYMPMTWLSDGMDECAEGIASADYADYSDEKLRGSGGKARGRLASVIQAFGGERWADVGWPRLPTWQEMDCLGFLSVVHGSRGIFFYTYSVMGKTEAGREALGRVVGRLNRVYPWLVVENSEETVQVEMISENRYDPKGRPAVQCCVKQKGEERLLIAVNTIGTYVEAALCAECTAQSARRMADGARGRASADFADLRRLEKKKDEKKVKEVFSGEDYVVRQGRIRVKIGPYEAKAFLFRRANGAEGRAQSG